MSLGVSNRSFSPNYHNFNKPINYVEYQAKPPSLIPIYRKLKDYGVTLTVDNKKLIRSTFDKSGYGPGEVGAYYDPTTKIMALSSDRSNLWQQVVPHEFAHVQMQGNQKLGKEMKMYFKDAEDMADSYSNYYNNPKKYSITNPVAYMWFEKNFMKSPSIK